MKINVLKTRKIFTAILITIVSILVIAAIFFNRNKFFDLTVIKYSQITINEKVNISDIINEYTDQSNKNIFIAELKKVNNLKSIDNDDIYGRTLMIPIFEN
jgi:hypothetical protein